MKFSVNNLFVLIISGAITLNSTLLAVQGASADTAWIANIPKARLLIGKKQYKEAETLLERTLPEAKKQNKRDQNYGRYLGLLGNALFSQNKQKEMIPFAEEALRVFYALPAEQRPPNTVLFANHADLAISYQSQGELEQAERQYHKAIDVAAQSSKDQIDKTWLKLCYKNLIFCLHAEGLNDQEKTVTEDMKKRVGG